MHNKSDVANFSFKEEKLAKPFLKWAGGKTQLLDQLLKYIPQEILESRIIERYVEPFVGGGAFFFFLKRKFRIKEAFLFDINRELIIGYKVIKNNYKQLIDNLDSLEEKYLQKDEKQRKEFYYRVRDKYNRQMHKGFDYNNYNNNWIERVSYLIFLNKTCFNGLFRQNQKGEFNVSHGRYKNPTICDKQNIIAVNKTLQNVKMVCGDFIESRKHINKNTLAYFDPPYRPLNKTSNFTGYFKENFVDEDQKRLAEFFKKMDQKGADLILSNSDPKNVDSKDDFFDNLYQGYRIDRVLAKRSINCKGAKRGKITELIITNNYTTKVYKNLKLFKT